MIKKIALALCIGCSLSSVSYAVENTNSSNDILKKLSDSFINNNYSIIFTVNSDNITRGFSYKHIVDSSTNNEHSILVNLEGKENYIYRLNKEIFYINNGIKLESKHIVDSLPNIFYANFEKLEKNYNVEVLGKARIAGRLGTIINLVSKSEDPIYNYQLVIDNETNNLLSAIETDPSQNNLIIESFTVVSLNNSISDWYKQINVSDFKDFNTLLLKNTIDEEQYNKVFNELKINYIPNGFSLIKVDLVNDIKISNDNIGNFYSLNYSDGLYDFTIYISADDIKSDSHYYWLYNNGTNLYAESFGGKEFFIIGELPLVTIKKILDNISFKKDTNREPKKGFGNKLTVNLK